MRVYAFDTVRYCESKDFFDEERDLDFLRCNVGRRIFSFTRRRGFRTLLEIYQRISGLEGYILLHAHGVRGSQGWSFADGKRRCSIQNFVDGHDGESLALLLQCCNPRKEEVSSERSIIIHPKHNINFLDLMGGGHLRMFIPGIGYLEDRKYALTEAIEQMRDR